MCHKSIMGPLITSIMTLSLAVLWTGNDDIPTCRCEPDHLSALKAYCVTL